MLLSLKKPRSEGWGTAEDAAVTPDRGRHVDFVHRVAFENLILGDQSCGAFGEKHLVAELDRRAHLAPFDQVGVRLEDRMNLFRCRHPIVDAHKAEIIKLGENANVGTCSPSSTRRRAWSMTRAPSAE